ncbi:hypothetical protein HHK36_024992 [Tetracentron sinense]|uniref:Pentatricopeptide repeat-containing protein n=1 Tax=Tetracentron sinense TaxID=13715 RepID=A0A835D570_TETSI|nr:hypothetical protein HHK36_024992 [Tetracentron sinense]
MALQQLSRSKSVVKRSKKYLEEPLYKRLFKDGSSEVSVRRELNQFIKGSKKVYKWEVGDSIKKLRHRNRFYPALKGCKWIRFGPDLVIFESDPIKNPADPNSIWDSFDSELPIQLSETMAGRGMNLTASDQAIHLDLIAKTRGISAAEKYFMDLPEASKNHLSYGALLNCYCKELMSEKAEALMEKMKEMRLASSSLAYNSLMTLYTKTGHPERIPAIIQEMKASNVMLDSYTCNVRMRALAAANDISGVERVIEEMKRDGRVAGDWTTYSNLASIYIDAGLFEKAEKALKELEKRNACRDLAAFQFLITLYGRTGNLLEVYRVWRSLRLAFPKTANISYLNMIQVLVNLKDLPGAEKCFREWESGCSNYDIRVANILIGAYAKEGMLEKAEEFKERARRRGAKPNAKTWEIFTDYYLKNGKIGMAVDCVTNAISTGRGDGRKWVPLPEVIGTLMAYFEQERDVEGAEVFVENLKKNSNKTISGPIIPSDTHTRCAFDKKEQLIRKYLLKNNKRIGKCKKKLTDVEFGN